MKTLGLLRRISALTALAVGLCTTSHAQLLIGQTVGVTGSAAATVKESMGGAALYINHVSCNGLSSALFSVRANKGAAAGISSALAETVSSAKRKAAKNLFIYEGLAEFLNPAEFASA